MKAVFLLGTLSKFADRGDALSTDDLRVLERVSDAAGLDADVVFATVDLACSYNPARATMGHLREQRERMLEEIRAAKPDVIMVFGPIALRALLNKGNVSLTENVRCDLNVEEFPGVKVVATYSLDHVAAQHGVEKWLVLDAKAAVNGQTETRFGEYTVLVPDDPHWDRCPSDLADLPAGSVVGFDLETYPGLDPWAPDARIRMAIISNSPHKATIVQLGADSRLPDWLVGILGRSDVVKAGSNIKFDYKWLRRFGVRVVNMHDTSVAEHLLDENNPFKGLKHLTFLRAPWLGDYSKGHRQLVAERGGWEFVDDDEQYDYAGADGEASYCCAKGQMEELKEQGLHRAYTLAHDLYDALCEMEHNGCVIDLDLNLDLEVKFEAAMSALRDEITETLGPINPASAKQLSDALFAKVKGINLTKRKTMRLFSERPGDEEDETISTDRETLEREAEKHPIIETILRWRRLNKLHTTYVKGIREKYLTYRDGVPYLTTTFREDVTDTNRLSSQGPNLQNQPSKPDPEDPHPIPLELNTKRQFVSRFDGGLILEADLAQAEIRVAAMLSKDQKMIDAITSGEDIHNAMAATLLDKPMDQVSKLERHRCKRLTFLILYGGGANTLSRQLGISKDEAKQLIGDYFRTFNRLDFYIQQAKMRARRDLELQSIFGYKRRFRAPAKWNSPDGWRIERQAFNFVIQNTAACILYCALIGVQDELVARKLRSKLIITVHDSLVVDVHPEELEVVAEMVRRHMTNPDTERYGVTLTVPMSADIEVGPSWGDKAKYALPSEDQ